MWPKVAKNLDTIVFTLKVDAFQYAQTVFKDLGHFYNKICCQELSKIAQSGPTVFERVFRCSTESYLWLTQY